MDKNIVKAKNRQRVQANLFSFVDNGNGTAFIGDVETNISVGGTRLEENLINGIQQGLVFSVNSTMTSNAGYDVYALDLIGLYGVNNLDGFPIFEGLSLNFKASATNTQGVVKISLSGSEYDLVKIQNGTAFNIKVGDILANNFYKLIFDGVKFLINLSNLQAYGTTTGTSLEGNQLSRILGIDDVFYGGTISEAGTKIAGKAYYDTNTKQIYLCRENNDLNYVDLNKFTAFSNKSLLDKLENLSKIKTQLISAPVTVTALYNTPKIYTYNLPVDKARVEYVKFTGLAIYSGTFSEIFSLFAKVDDSDEFQTFAISPEGTSVASNIKLEVTNNQVKMTIKNLNQTLATTVLQKLVVYHI